MMIESKMDREGRGEGGVEEGGVGVGEGERREGRRGERRGKEGRKAEERGVRGREGRRGEKEICSVRLDRSIEPPLTSRNTIRAA